MAVQDIAALNMTPVEDMKSKVSEKIGEVQKEEESLAMDMSPKGSFSKGALNSLVKAHNAVTVMFGLPAYPMFSKDETIFPAKFTKELLMVSKAVDDAIKADVLTSDMSFVLENVKADRDLSAISGKLSMLAKSKDFKKFLQEAPEEEVMAEEEAPVKEGMSETEMDQMFMGRM
jgi:hypothetical protein